MNEIDLLDLIKANALRLAEARHLNNIQFFLNRLSELNAQLIQLKNKESRIDY